MRQNVSFRSSGISLVDFSFVLFYTLIGMMSERAYALTHLPNGRSFPKGGGAKASYFGLMSFTEARVRQRRIIMN